MESTELNFFRGETLKLSRESGQQAIESILMRAIAEGSMAEDSRFRPPVEKIESIAGHRRDFESLARNATFLLRVQAGGKRDRCR